MIYNRIPVVFGNLRKITIPPVSFQYDIVQKLIISGLELPEYYQVDFCNEGDSESITMIGTADGVDVPDQFLQTGKTVKAYLVVTGVDAGAAETRYEITIPVNKRPTRTDIEPTPVEQSTIDSLIAASSKDWRLERMATVDRNITRLATFEIRFAEETLTPNIAINEAVELAKKYGTDDSSRYVNGILGAMMKAQ